MEEEDNQGETFFCEDLKGSLEPGMIKIGLKSSKGAELYFSCREEIGLDVLRELKKTILELDRDVHKHKIQLTG